MSWSEFTTHAPRIAEIFERRHAASGHLCLLGTIRASGAPRVSPMEPAIFEGDLVLVGMPGTAKFDDLARDPRFELHTATVDPQVGEGDAKVWGSVADVNDESQHRRFADDLYARTGFDLRERHFEHFFVAHIAGASAVEIVDGTLEITTWRIGGNQQVIQKR